jgi:enoyl-CoA hydratase
VKLIKKELKAQWEIADGIGIMTLENPPGNTLTRPDFVSLSNLKKWFGHNGLKGIIVTGAGRHFSDGADIESLNEIQISGCGLSNGLETGKEILSFIDKIDLPVIAAINGACMGGGLEIALACHIRVASKRSLFSFPETNLGIMPGLGGSIRLTRLLGRPLAAEIILSGKIISAQEAFDIGIIDHLIEEKNALEFATQLIRSMTENRSCEQIRLVMRSIHNSILMPTDDAMREETNMFCRLAVKSRDDQSANSGRS